MYYQRATQNQPTLSETIQRLETWQAEHEPFDRTSSLNLFQFIQSVDEGAGAALVPLADQLPEDSRFPTVYLRERALHQYLYRLLYPQTLYNRLPARLNCLNVNWLVQNGNYERPALIRMQDNDQARALMTSLYQPIDTLDLLRMIEPNLGDGRVRWHYDDELTFHLSVSFPNYAEEIKKGDVVEHGIHISNSEVGIRSVTVAAYLYRLVCTNGLIGGGNNGDSFRFRHIGNPEVLRDKILTAVESTKLEATRIVAQFKNALNVKIDEPFQLLEAVAKERDLTQEEFKAVLNSFMEADNDKDNLYGVAQAISNAANTFEGERSYELQRVAVDVTGIPKV